MARLLLAPVLLLGFWVLAPPAAAGEYHVYSCRTPAGTVAPTDGWSGSINGPWMYDPNSCASGGSLTGALDGGVAQPANMSDAGWSFSAPAGTSIVAARLWRAGSSRSWTPGVSTVYWLAAPEDSYSSADVFDQCAAYAGCAEVGDPSTPMAQANLVEVPRSNLSGATHIFMNAACGGSNGYSCPAVPGGGYSVAISLYAADIALVDNTPPTASNMGGSLAAGGRLSGVGDISFSAADTGSGLYQAVFLVDGRAVSRQLLNSGSGPCRDVGGTGDGTHAFFYVQPCPLALSDDLSFDSSLAPDGSHLLAVQLLDAAGNATTILNRQVTFANHGVSPGTPVGPGSPLSFRGQANGNNASDEAKLTAGWTRTRKALLTSRFGVRNRISGRLIGPGGQGISGASIDVYETSAYHGAPAQHLGEVSSGPNGQWTLILARDVPSSTLRFEYRSHQNDTVAAATSTLRLNVHAGIVLSISPHLSSIGRQISFSGILRGTPIPEGGKQLVLEARSGREWIQFNTIRTNAHGRYHATYRFKFPGPITYQFRVLSRYEADFPFLDGTSRVVAVHEL
jgi:hypothetical protein